MEIQFSESHIYLLPRIHSSFVNLPLSTQPTLAENPTRHEKTRQTLSFTLYNSLSLPSLSLFPRTDKHFTIYLAAVKFANSYIRAAYKIRRAQSLWICRNEYPRRQMEARVN